MAEPTIAEIRALDTTGNGYAWATDEVIQVRFLASVLPQYAAMKSARDYARIVALHTAHKLELAGAAQGQPNQVGPVVSASAGGVSMSVGVNAVAADALERTGPGQDLKELLTINGPYVRVGTALGWWR